MTVVALWLLIAAGNTHRPLSYVPFATKEACQAAIDTLSIHAGWQQDYYCVSSGARP
jgi:hypothetical protein